MLDIDWDVFREGMENTMSKVGERCGPARMPNGTPVNHCLKTSNGTIEIVAIVAPPVESVCLVRCISQATALPLKTRTLIIISNDHKILAEMHIPGWY
jgi:hypothetical protein